MTRDDDDDDDPCFCGCCGPLLKCGWNNCWRIVLFACALGVVVILGVSSWLFVQSLRIDSESRSVWAKYAAPLFFAGLACMSCLCGGCIWVILCPARKKKKRHVVATRRSAQEEAHVVRY